MLSEFNIYKFEVLFYVSSKLGFKIVDTFSNVHNYELINMNKWNINNVREFGYVVLERDILNKFWSNFYDLPPNSVRILFLCQTLNLSLLITVILRLFQINSICEKCRLWLLQILQNMIN